MLSVEQLAVVHRSFMNNLPNGEGTLVTLQVVPLQFGAVQRRQKSRADHVLKGGLIAHAADRHLDIAAVGAELEDHIITSVTSLLPVAEYPMNVAREALQAFSAGAVLGGLYSNKNQENRTVVTLSASEKLGQAALIVKNAYGLQSAELTEAASKAMPEIERYRMYNEGQERKIGLLTAQYEAVVALGALLLADSKK